MRAAALLNTRGLTELVVLQAGREAGILRSKLYLILVAIALLSTALAGPFSSFVTRRSPADNPIGAIQPIGVHLWRTASTREFR
jgi:Kef-type K+ transport system membrane component KefB